MCAYSFLSSHSEIVEENAHIQHSNIFIPMFADFVNTLKGKYHDGCSASNFLLHMAVAGTCREIPQRAQTINGGQWRVFCNESSSVIGSEQESIQDKIKYFLLDKKCWAEFAEDALVQLWVPATNSAGRTLLTSSEQHFGITAMGGTELEGDLLYNGLCSYRCYSIYLGDFAEDITQFGPLGRAFTKGYPEFCANIKAYSIEEFPMRDYAIKCGIERYWALPLFQLGASHQQHCVGVLEGLSFGIRVFPLLNTFGMILDAFEELGLQCPDYNHRDKCLNSRVNLLESQEGIIEMVKSLQDEYGLPLSQVWVPCMCDATHQDFLEGSKVTQLFFHFTFLDRDLAYATELRLMTMDFPVKSGKGLVGRAFLENKALFCHDTTRFSISDYPLLPLTRSSGLTSCFAIPLQLLHPHITSSILEVFLPPLRNCVRDLELVLRSLLSIMSAKLPSFNASNGTQRDFSVKISHSESEEDDNFVYFDVDRIDGAMSSADNWFQPLRLQHNAQCLDDDTNVDAEVTRENDTNAQVQIPEVNEETVPSDRKEGQIPSLNQTRADEKPKAKSSRNAFTSRRKPITRDDLEEHFDKSIDEAAKDLGVSRSTVKRICRKYDLDRWPSRKRNKIRDVHSDPRPIEVGNGSEVFQESEIVVPVNEASAAISARAMKKITSIGEEIDQSYSMEVKATYIDDTVLFNLSSDSRMEELRRNLEERFELDAVKRYKIKYEYEGDWIMIACDKDLRLRMDTLRSIEQTRMNLSVFSVAVK